MRDVPAGEQSYSVNGRILCSNSGIACVASGSEQMNVVDGAIYEVVWRLAGQGTCEIGLSA